MKEGQIKGDKQQAELTEATNFISNKFDQQEKDRKEKEGRTKTLENCLIKMEKRVDSYSGQVEKHEQYSRHDFLSLHGILESRNDKTDDLCVAAINEHFELSITAADTNRTNQIGKPRDAVQTTRPIIIKFVRYNNRKNVLNRKKN